MKRAKSENDGDDVNNLKQPYLSGAYIRSFVKQLASSRSSMREKSSVEGEADPPPKPKQQQHDQIPPQQHHKKQVRRRLQTRKPYQEKLLNMAEARREIVSALKLHRAAMKQQQQQQQQEIIQSRPDYQTEQKSRRNPRIYASNADVNFCCWPAPTAPPPPPVFLENLDFALPSQALGLNLNLHDFIHSSIYSSSSPSTSSSSPPPPPPPPPPAHAAERFKFLNCVGIRGEEEREEEIVSSPFDEVMEFPPWLNANESCLEHVDDQDFVQGSVLPCMDIEEIEGIDGDWLA